MRAAAKCPLKLGVAPARRQFYQQVGQLFLPNVWVVGQERSCSFKTKYFISNKSNDNLINAHLFYLLLSPSYPSWREGYVGAIYISCIFVEIQLQTKGNEIVSRTGGKMNTCINIIYLIEDTKIQLFILATLLTLWMFMIMKLAPDDDFHSQRGW